MMLGKALRDCEAGRMTHLDEIECSTITESIKRRIEDLDLKIAELGEHHDSGYSAASS